MKAIWKLSKKLLPTIISNIPLFLFLTTLFSSLMGYLVWYGIHFFLCNSTSAAICFIGYAGYFIGFLGGILYLYKNEFS